MKMPRERLETAMRRVERDTTSAEAQKLADTGVTVPRGTAIGRTGLSRPSAEGRVVDVRARNTRRDQAPGCPA
jgi:hypothetical protein